MSERLHVINDGKKNILVLDIDIWLYFFFMLDFPQSFKLIFKSILVLTGSYFEQMVDIKFGHLLKESKGVSGQSILNQLMAMSLS